MTVTWGAWIENSGIPATMRGEEAVRAMMPDLAVMSASYASGGGCIIVRGPKESIEKLLTMLPVEGTNGR